MKKTEVRAVKAMEFKTKTGGTVRIMTDCVPKTEEELQRNRQIMRRTCLEVLANAVAANGEEETLRRMKNGPHAGLIPGRA